MKKNYKKILIVFLALIIVISFLGFQNKGQNLKVREESSSNIEQKDIDVSLVVLGKIYRTSIKEGGTVYGVMAELQNEKENDFSFRSQNYTGLGAFITKINGVGGKSGFYWIYYVNKKEASIGVSKYILKSGDIISWKQQAS